MAAARTLDDIAQWLFSKLGRYSLARPYLKVALREEIKAYLQDLDEQSRQELSDRLDPQGYTALQYAFEYCDPAMVEMLSVDELWYDEDDIRHVNPKNKKNLLHSAVLNKNPVLFQMAWTKLKEDKELPAQTDSYNKTPYDYAVLCRKKEAQKLLRAGFFKALVNSQQNPRVTVTYAQAGKFAEIHAFLEPKVGAQTTRVNEYFVSEIVNDFIACLDKIARDEFFPALTIQASSPAQTIVLNTYTDKRFGLELKCPTLADLKQYLEFLNSGNDCLLQKLPGDIKQKILALPVSGPASLPCYR